MPFIGFDCPRYRVADPGACRSCMDRDCDYPPWLLQALAEGYQKREEGRISPTTLLSCYRALFIKRTVPYTIDPRLEWPKMRGTILHKFIENQTPREGIVREVEVSKQLALPDGRVVEIRGVPDEVWVNDGLIVDYKHVSVIVDVLRNRDKPEWVAQLSCYRWLLHPGVQISSGRIVMFDAKGWARRDYTLWSIPRTEEWLRKRVLLLLNMQDIPPKLEKEDRWRCTYCEVRRWCDAQDLPGGTI